MNAGAIETRPVLPQRRAVFDHLLMGEGSCCRAALPRGVTTHETSHAYNAELVKQLTSEMQAVIANYGTPIDSAGEQCPVSRYADLVQSSSSGCEKATSWNGDQAKPIAFVISLTKRACPVAASEAGLYQLLNSARYINIGPLIRADGIDRRSVQARPPQSCQKWTNGTPNRGSPREKGEESMSTTCRCRLLLVLVSLSPISGCCGGGCDGNSTAVVFSDVHFNPFYDPALFPALNSADPGGWADIFSTSSITAPSSWGADTNFPLLALTMSSIRQQAGGGPWVVFTGDLLGHNFAETFFGLSVSQDLAAMQAFADKTVSFVMDQVRASVGDVPVLFAVGNADSYDGVAPEAGFLSNTAELYYTKFLNGRADHSAFLETFTRGGYYSADLPGTDLTVIALNTLMLTGEDPGVTESDVTAQLDWFEAALVSVEIAGRKAWLLMHAPPGAVISQTAGLLDGQGYLAGAEMMWQAPYQVSFLEIVARHRGVLKMTFAGHTHMDEYRIMSDSICHVSPGISPCFGDNPAYKVFAYSNFSLEAVDYISLNYDLAAMPGQFNCFYAFSSAYSKQGLLDASMTQLYPELAAGGAKQSLYREYYYSGLTPANPITDANWRVYWCGIGNMGQQELIDCVNSD